MTMILGTFLCFLCLLDAVDAISKKEVAAAPCFGMGCMMYNFGNGGLNNNGNEELKNLKYPNEIPNTKFQMPGPGVQYGKGFQHMMGGNGMFPGWMMGNWFKDMAEAMRNVGQSDKGKANEVKKVTKRTAENGAQGHFKEVIVEKENNEKPKIVKIEGDVGKDNKVHNLQVSNNSDIDQGQNKKNDKKLQKLEKDMTKLMAEELEEMKKLEEVMAKDINDLIEPQKDNVHDNGSSTTSKDSINPKHKVKQILEKAKKHK